MQVEEQIREIALNLSIRSYQTDTPSGDDLLKRAHRFAHFIREGQIIPAPTLQEEEK